MKKVLSFTVTIVAIISFLVFCGPNKKERQEWVQYHRSLLNDTLPKCKPRIQGVQSLSASQKELTIDVPEKALREGPEPIIIGPHATNGITADSLTRYSVPITIYNKKISVEYVSDKEEGISCEITPVNGHVITQYISKGQKISKKEYIYSIQIGAYNPRLGYNIANVRVKLTDKGYGGACSHR